MMGLADHLAALREQWAEIHRAARAQEWHDATERGDCTAADAVAGQRAGIRAPLTYGQRAGEADDEITCAMFAGGDPCPIAERMSAGRQLGLPDLHRIRDAGGDLGFAFALLGAGDLVKGRVTQSWRHQPATFEFGGPDGRIVLAVRDENFAREDAVAFRLDAPGDFALMLGQSAFLGEWLLRDRHVEGGGRLRLVADPLAWIAARGKAVCVLDWQRAVPKLRDLGERVTIEAPPALATVLRARLERGGLPLVASAVAEGTKLTLAERIGRAA
ncbi:hypothetical protein J3454_14300 [Erythrobacter sp. NFXS35]|uniref:hypothetical protein n=1 Tax=Erythrobacter sp. NFXS35 TaxID=2818436 RepID=UPI0032DE86E9